MTPEDIAPFEKKLIALEVELTELASAGEQGTETVELDQARVGRLSRMDALQGQAMSQETQRRRQLQLVEVRRALQRVKNGQYGECQNCGEFIAIERLDFKPETLFCVTCAVSQEQ